MHTHTHTRRHPPTQTHTSVLSSAPMISARWKPKEYALWPLQVTAQAANREIAKPAASDIMCAASARMATLQEGK
eukprot:1063285-Pelagomonas_calceolata.AAC.1